MGKHPGFALSLFPPDPGVGGIWEEHGMGLEWLSHGSLLSVLQEASQRFTLPGSAAQGPAKQENFILGSSG